MTATEPKKNRGRGRFSPTGGKTVQIRVGAKTAETLRKQAEKRKTTIAVVVAEKVF